MSTNILFEVTVLNGSTPITLRMASAAATAAGCQLNGYGWTPLITKRHSITGSWAEDGILQTGEVNNSSLSFRMSSAYENEVWSSYEWTGGLARIFVQTGSEGDFSTYKQVFEGSVSSLDRNGINATVGLLGPDALLDRDLLTLEYQGTGNAEGAAALKGKLKPRAFGYCQSVEPILVDSASWIYQVHGYGAVSSIKPYEYAQALDAAKNKGDASDFATLKGITLLPGEWATCVALGMFRLGGTPSQKVSADVVAGGASTVATILAQLLTLAGIPAAKQGTFSAFSTANWNLYATDQMSIGEVARAAVYQAGGMLFADGTGKWQVMDYYSSSTPIVLNADRSTAPLVKTVRELPAAAPIWKVKVGYDRCWGVHSASEVSPALRNTSDQSQAAADAAAAAIEAARIAQADVNVSKQRLDAIANDGILDRSDKAYLVQRFSTATAERPTLLAKGNPSAERTAYSNAYDALKTYLEGLCPAYSDTSADTPIDLPTFNARWRAFDTSRSALYTSLADWKTLTGDGKPADNATVGAPIGTNVGGVEAGALVNTANTANSNASTALNAVKDKNGTVTGIQTVIDSVAAEVTRAKQEVADTRTSLNTDIAAAKQEGTTARNDLAAAKTSLGTDIAAAKQEGTTARNDLATEVARAKGAEGTITTNVTNLKTTQDGQATTIRDNFTTLTNADTALANRSSVMESKAGSNGAININPTFAQYTNATGTADGWNYDNQTNGGATRVAGETGGYAVQLASSANASAYSAQQLGAVAANSYWVIEADVKLNSGTLNGAGVLFRAGPDYRIVFASDKDSTDTVVGAGTIGQTYRFRKLVQMTAAATGSALWYMSHWSALGDVSAANNLTWYRCAIRPATDAEIMAKKADTALNTPVTGVVARIGTEEATRANADSAISTRTTNLETTVNTGSDRNSALRASVNDEVTARSNGDSALATRASNLEATVNTGPDRNSALRSSVSDEATARTNADSALATRASNLESTVNSGTDGNTALKARIGTEEATRANADSALATRTTVMESAASGTGSLNGNSNYALWPDGAPLPTKWIYWEAPTGWSLIRVPSGRPTSPYAVRIGAPANADCGIAQWYNDGNTSVPMTPGWYVMECDVTLESGTWNGSGMSIQGVYNYNFATQPDISGVTSATQTGNRRFSWLVQNTNSYTNWHPMANWSGFGIARDAKTLTWYRAAIRPATDAEILAKKADIALNTPGTGVVARITAEETTRAGADSALVSKTDTMITEYRGNNTNLNTRIFNEETARSNGDSALATRSTALEARSAGGGNLITNTDFLSSTANIVADGWNAFSVTNLAPVFGINIAGDAWHLPSENALSIFQSGQAGASGYTGYTSNRFAVTPGGYLQAYCFMATHRCQSELIIYWFDGAGNTLTASTSGAAGGTGADQNGGQNINGWRQSGFPAVAVPSGAVQASLELRKYNTNTGQGDSYTWFTRPYAGAARANTTEFTPFSPGSAKAGITATTARIGTEETTRANADSALSTRTQNLESSVNSGGNNLGALRASINDEATTRANADSAVAARTSFLETTATATAGTNIVSNDKFAIWRDGQPIPDRWNNWIAEGNYRVERQAGIKGSPYCIRTLNDTSEVNSGFVQTIRITPGKWVMEVTAESDGSGFRGAGITLSGIYNLDFCAVPDINGTAGDTVNSIRSYAMVFDVSHNQDLSFHCMHGWSGFGRGMAAKYMKWHAVSLRPAGPGDIAGVNNAAAIATANVRIGNEETARSNADSALGTRTNTLESNYTTVRNNLDTWNNDRYQDYLRVNSRVGTEETTRSNADSAIANRTSVVEAQVASDSNNLLRNGIFNAPNWVARGVGGVPPYWAVWSQDNGAFIGASPRDSRYGAPAPLQIDRNGINNGVTQGLPALPQGWFVFEIDITGEDGNWSGSGLHCNFNNGYGLNFGFAVNADTAGRVGDIGTANRQFSTLFYNGAPSNGANLYLMAGWSGFQGATNFGFVRTVWHRVVMRPASDAEIQARKVQDSNLIARVSTTESAVSNLNGRTSAYWQVQAVAGNNRAQMTVRADANGGAGVDIVGDVNFSGNLNVGPDSGGNRMKLTNSGLWLYDANGTLRAQLSL